MAASSTSLPSCLTSLLYGTLRSFTQTPITQGRSLYLPSSSTSFTTSLLTTTMMTIAFSFSGTVTSSLKALLNRIGPQLCGSLFATRQQSASARAFWNFIFAGFTRVNAADKTAPFTSLSNLFGLGNQISWFHYTSMVMHQYSKFFKGSVPFIHTGLGAVAVRGMPSVNEATRSFLYPTDAEIEPFTSGRFHPRRQISYAMSVQFQHCEYDGLEEEAERYAVVTHTNLRWPIGNDDQNEWTRINSDVTHQGDAW